jgi:hypothetical protein
MQEENLNFEDSLLLFITQSGFNVVPVQAIIDALSEMEEYIMNHTGLSHEELDIYMKRIEELLGKEEAMHLQLDEIISWIKAIKGF